MTGNTFPKIIGHCFWTEEIFGTTLVKPWTLELYEKHPRSYDGAHVLLYGSINNLIIMILWQINSNGVGINAHLLTVIESTMHFVRHENTTVAWGDKSLFKSFGKHMLPGKPGDNVLLYLSMIYPETISICQ